MRKAVVLCFVWFWFCLVLVWFGLFLDRWMPCMCVCTYVCLCGLVVGGGGGWRRWWYDPYRTKVLVLVGVEVLVLLLVGPTEPTCLPSMHKDRQTDRHTKRASLVDFVSILFSELSHLSISFWNWCCERSQGCSCAKSKIQRQY